MTRKEQPYLPDEVMLNCLARVSRLYYPTLSLVSKRFRSLISSKELYHTRSILGTTENCFYLGLESKSSCGSNPFWFTLFHRSPRQTILSRFASYFCPRKSLSRRKNLMVLVPTPKLSPPLTKWATSVIGSDIYIIGGCINGEPSSRVFVMDCVSHTWREAPSMHLPRRNPLAGVCDGIIYVKEGFLDDHFGESLIEFFDPKTQVWEYLTVKKNLFLCWDVKPFQISHCMIDSVIYSHAIGRLVWWDWEGNILKNLKGCEELANSVKGGHVGIRLANLDGKIAVFWEEDVHAFGSMKKKKKIWCAQVTLEKRNGQEMYGIVNHCGVVLTLPRSASFEQYVVSTL